MNFSDLGLAAPILMALEGEGYTTPTPIQTQAIPPVLAGSDLLGIAQTGTGKTAAFALPSLTRLAADRRRPLRRGCRMLVLSPTRELASQIAESFRTYGRHLGITVAVVFGGVGHGPQISALARGVDVLVATPGRLLDHVGERNIDLSGTEIFVLDEADQMLDLGFVKPIRQIVAQLPSRRQNLFFSATMPKEIAGLADDLLKNPVKVAVAPVATTAERVSQRIIHVEADRKRAILVELLADPAMVRTLVFTRTKRGADRVARHLETHATPAAAIHGNKSQRQREQALEAFKQGRIRVLVATDIAARGIDIDGVTHVVNYELPEVPEAYVHRIGRTARAGASGCATSLCDNGERDLLRAIERLTRQQIPAEDRRNDAGLAAAAAAEPRISAGRHERRMPGAFRDAGPRRERMHQSRNGEARGREDRPVHARSSGAAAGAPSGKRGERGDGPRTEAPRSARSASGSGRGEARPASGDRGGHRSERNDRSDRFDRTARPHRGERTERPERNADRSEPRHDRARWTPNPLPGWLSDEPGPAGRTDGNRPRSRARDAAEGTRRDGERSGRPSSGQSRGGQHGDPRKAEQRHREDRRASGNAPRSRDAAPSSAGQKRGDARRSRRPDGGQRQSRPLTTA